MNAARSWRRVFRFIPATALAAATAACGGVAVVQVSPSAEALAYVRAHPVRPVAGMTTGVLLSVDVAGFAGAAATEAGCPPSLTAYIAPAAGSPPACAAWSATAETAAGAEVSLSCGSAAARLPCPMLVDGNENTYVPSPGDFVRFRTGGLISAPGDIRPITQFALLDLLGQSPDPGPVFVTTWAGGA